MNLFTPILVTGADARSYLQGQLTCDIDKLTRNNALLACCNSAQGRVQAVFTLIERSDGIILLVVPEMADRTIARLRKYILRSKVTIEDAGTRLSISGLTASQLTQSGAARLDAVSTHQQSETGSVVRWHDAQVERYILIASSDVAGLPSLTRNEWLLFDIRAGLPHIFPETHEAFVAQMLNLDLLSGISFEKGCYTGQEIIARTHFRGTIKRRMYRFVAATAPPAPGARLLVNGEHAGDVAYAAATDGGCELLAVISLSHEETILTADQSSASFTRSSLPYQLSPK
jgi:folate-binding protein YgfZ